MIYRFSFIILLSCLAIFSCEKTPVSSIQEQVSEHQKNKNFYSDNLNLTNETEATTSKRLKPRNPCDNVRVNTDQLIVWESGCMINTYQNQVSASSLMNNFFKRCLPVYDNSYCFEDAEYVVISRTENEQTCPPLFNHLDFEYQIGMTPEELAGVISWANQLIAANVPAGYTLLKVETFTELQNCEIDQTYSLATCEPFENPTIYPCGSLFWQNAPDCSLCKDICESRTLSLRLTVAKLCKEDPSPPFNNKPQ